MNDAPSAIDALIASARGDLPRVEPADLARELAEGAVVVDIRPVHQRSRDGALPGSVVVDRNVLEWRLDPTCAHRLPIAVDRDVRYILVCDEGYSSSLAAATLRELGLHRTTDLAGGYQSWLRWHWRHTDQQVRAQAPGGQDQPVTAELHVLTNGYASDRVASTVTLVREGHTVAVVDPGMVADRALILDPLRALGVEPEQVTDVVFSHHHLDHTLNAALFPHATAHDFMATYKGDVWTDRDPSDAGLGPSIRLLATPGHTDQDVSTLVETGLGLVVLTHLWWTESGPAEDPFAADRDVLRTSRERILELSPAMIVPGHGAPFVPGPDLAH